MSSQHPQDGVEEHRTRAPAAPREAAAWVAAHLARAGYRALFAGGCVRDRLLGLDPADYDVATSATPEQIRVVFPHAIGVGESFGVMLVRHGGRTIEVATFRSESGYADGRRPTEVRFTDEREDALRRDFTINGLFEDPVTGQILDYVNGRADLQARVLRAIGDATERFREDRLRALRAVRFTARFALALDPATRAAVQAFAHDLAGVSRERIGHEVRRMLAHPSRAAAVELCEALDLAPSVLNEPAGALDLAPLRALPPEAVVPTGLASWMLGRGGVTTKARQEHWRAALCLSNTESDQLAATLALRARMLEGWAAADAAGRKRMAASDVFAGALQLVASAQPTLAAQVQADYAALSATGLAPQPFLTGEDLIRAGMRPGPGFKTVLDTLYDQQLNGVLATREQALAALARWPSGQAG